MPDGKEKNVICFNTDIDPRTDPSSPQFDPVIWRQANEEANKRMKQELARITKSLQETIFTSSNIAEIIDAFKGMAGELANLAYTKEREAGIKALSVIIDDLCGLLDWGEISGQESLYPIDEQARREKVTEAISAFDTSLLAGHYAVMLNGTPTNDFMRITKKSADVDSFTRSATFTVGNGRSFKAENIDNITGPLSTSAQKILDAAAIYLKGANYYRGNTITPTVEIPLIEYGERCKVSLSPRQMPTAQEQAAENARVDERKKEFKKTIRRDLRDISSIVWSGEETKGRNKGDYKDMRIISSHSIRGGVIRINFDIDAATFLVNAYPMYFPLALLGHDNRNPSAYTIGRKIAYHNSLDHNAEKGTDCTLSVQKLLDAAPEIPTYSAIVSRGQRNWKDKIKRPLETALDANIAVGYLKQWEYRNPRTGETYSKDSASALSWDGYSGLMVDFSLVCQPDQQERRSAAAEKKAIEKGTPKKARNK